MGWYKPKWEFQANGIPLPYFHDIATLGSATAVAVAGTEIFSAPLSLLNAMKAEVSVLAVDTGGAAAAGMYVNVYKSLDGTNWDTEASDQLQIASGGAPGKRRTFTISNAKFARLGFVRIGADDTFNVTAQYDRMIVSED